MRLSRRHESVRCASADTPLVNLQERHEMVCKLTVEPEIDVPKTGCGAIWMLSLNLQLNAGRGDPFYSPVLRTQLAV